MELGEILIYTSNLEILAEEYEENINKLNRLIKKTRRENAALRAYVDELEYELGIGE